LKYVVKKSQDTAQRTIHITNRTG